MRQFVLKFIFKILFKLKVVGADNIEKAGKKVLIVANHTSFLDGLLLFAYLPIGTTFVSLKSFQKNWLFRFITIGIPIYYIDFQEPITIKQIIAALNKNSRIVIFPEGRITVTGSTMKIYNGPSLILAHTDATVLPIYIGGAKFSLFSRLKGKVKRSLFPNITINIQKPVEIKIKNKKNISFSEIRAQCHSVLEKIMSEMNFKAANYNITIQESLIKVIKASGKFFKIAEDHERSSTTYFSILLKIFLISKILKNNKKDNVIGILLPTSIMGIVSVFSVLFSKKIPAMLNFTLGKFVLKKTLEVAKVGKIITSRKFLSTLEIDLNNIIDELKIKVIYLEDLKTKITCFDKIMALVKALFPKIFIEKVKPSSPAIILFTSGSEGLPKAVALSHENINANICQVLSVIDLTVQDKVFNILPIFHSFGLTVGTLLPILCGIPVFLYPSPLHANMIPSIAYDINATIFFGTDTLLKLYGKNAHNYDFYSTRLVFAGGEKLREDTRKLWFDKFGIRIMEGYGITETSPILSVNTPMHNRKGSVGQFFPEITYTIEKIDGIDKGGKLWVNGPNVMLGYIDPNSSEFKINPIKDKRGHDTGDIVDVDEDGYIFIKDRVKRFVKIGGEMISLTFVEENIKKMSPNHLHAIISKEDSSKGESLILMTTDKTLTRSDIVKFFKEMEISMIMVPKEIKAVDEMPPLGSGKINYVELKSALNNVEL